MNRLEELLLKLVRHWQTYYVLAWLVAATAAAVALHQAWRSFDNTMTGNNRPDGNCGHATIDFGGQWLMGRMLVTGNGWHLYNRTVQREVLRPAYPDEDQEPGRSDVENLMSWVMGKDDPEAARSAGLFALPLAAADPLQGAVLAAACDDEKARLCLLKATAKQIGGPLYPPINAFVYSPLGLFAPRTAYRMQQVANLALVFLAALGLSLISRGRLWLPVVATGIMLFPGFGGSLNLGQNATLTLTVLVWGWVLVSRGRPGWGGVVWGLLAFKPVWALAFFLVPLLSGRWRTCLTMTASGAALGLLTLPFVGLHSWFDWLQIGREAAELYNIEENWIFLSRDILSIPRRWMFDFRATQRWERDPNWMPPALIGWSIILLVLEVTVRTAVLRRRQAQAPDGPPAAFLFLGAWMCCFHFMYYDVLLGALPVFLLFTEPRRYLEPLLLAVVPLHRGAVGRAVTLYHRPGVPEAVLPPVPLLQAGYGHLWVLNRMAPTLFVLLVAINYLFPVLNLGNWWGPPWDTFTLMALWAWCGWQWLKHGEKIATGWDDGSERQPLPALSAGPPLDGVAVAVTSSTRQRVAT